MKKPHRWNWLRRKITQVESQLNHISTEQNQLGSRKASIQKEKKDYIDLKRRHEQRKNLLPAMTARIPKNS